MRAFIRHPTSIPIEIYVHGAGVRIDRKLNDVSLGGLCCESDAFLDAETMITVRIPLVQPVFEADARVVWCKRRDEGFRIGVEFLDATDGYRSRMVEQVCHIEHYRNELRAAEGRELDWEEAAREWIDKYASKFPSWGYNDSGD